MNRRSHHDSTMRHGVLAVPSDPPCRGEPLCVCVCVCVCRKTCVLRGDAVCITHTHTHRRRREQRLHLPEEGISLLVHNELAVKAAKHKTRRREPQRESERKKRRRKEIVLKRKNTHKKDAPFSFYAFSSLFCLIFANGRVSERESEIRERESEYSGRGVPEHCKNVKHGSKKWSSVLEHFCKRL